MRSICLVIKSFIVKQNNYIKVVTKFKSFLLLPLNLIISYIFFWSLQGRTDRIVFKLFGKEPSDFPFALRGQVLFKIVFAVIH